MLTGLGSGAILAFLALAAGPDVQAPADDLGTQLMLSTLKVANPASTATAFVLSRPAPDDPAKTHHILVTAEHVMSRMAGDEATIFYRKREPDGHYVKLPVKLAIRRDGRPLWTRHPSADVAVLTIAPPAEATLGDVAVDRLARDADLARFGVHPGDLIRCVGYPHPNQFDANGTGFAVVRLGCIASYPLLPTDRTGTFLADLNTFEGDSGAPVYFSEPSRSTAGNSGNGRAEALLGLVTGQHFIDEEYKMIYQAGKTRHRMGLAIVLHASAIRATIDRLPREP